VIIMIAVKVRTILALKRIIGSGEVDLTIPEGSTLEEVIATLVNRAGDELASQLYEPKSKTLRPYIRLMVNGRDIAFLNRMQTILQNEDEILMLPPVSGG